MSKVTIDRELLERVVKADASNGASSVDLVDGWKAMEQIRAILAAPRQPEGEWLEVVAWQDAENPLYTTAERRVLHDWVNNGYPIVELCRLSDHQRAIAELRERLDVMNQCADNYSRMFEESAEECERLHEAQKNYFSVTIQHGAAVAEAQAERDTLRQQLAEARDEITQHSNDLSIAYMAGGADMRQQRDRLAELLRMVRQDGWYHPLEDHEIAHIDAALAEVKP